MNKKLWPEQYVNRKVQEHEDAIIELEQFVGVSGSEVFTPRVEFVAASGFLQSGIDDTLTELVTVSGFCFIQLELVSNLTSRHQA